MQTYVHHHCKPSTQMLWQSILCKHILPVFGNQPLDVITRRDVQTFAYHLLETLTPGTTKNILTVLSGIFEHAIDEELLTDNPTKRIKLPKQKAKRAIEALSRADWLHLLRHIEQNRPKWHPFFYTLALTGMRIGEAIGLQWGDIDWNNKLITVQRRVYLGKVDTPKSGKSRRVDMSTRLCEVLQAHQAQVEMWALAEGHELPQWVFPNLAGNTYAANDVREKVWYRLLNDAGLPRLTPHVLRHTYATLLIQDNQSLAYVQQQLGHASIKITVDTYGHLVPGGNRQAVDRLDNVLVEVGEGDFGATSCNPHATQRL